MASYKHHLSRQCIAREQQRDRPSVRCANFVCLIGLLALGILAISLSSLRVVLGYPHRHKLQRSGRLDPQELNRTLFLQSIQDPWTPEELHRLNLLLEGDGDVVNLELVRRRWQRDIPEAASRARAARAASIDVDSYYRHDHRPNSGYRRISARGSRLPVELTHPRYSTRWAEASQALRSWLRKKRYDPSVMNELVDQVSAPIVKVLNSSATGSSGRFRQCAVVGNSGILLNTRYGSFIDSHEAVLRLNNARVTGFEQHVGSKTTLSFINSNVLALCSRRPGCNCHPYGSSVATVVYMCQALHFVHLKLCGSLMTDMPLLVTDPRFDALCMRIVKYYSLKKFFQSSGAAASASDSIEHWKRMHDGSFFHYSSGMQAVMLALGICDSVNIFGFGKAATAKHHYHTNQRGELNLHDYAAEYTLYQDLANNKSNPFLDEASGFKLPAVRVFT
ncbi:glycosyltransferase, CAZy family GT29 [Selaginella moellendorffii]|uniref:Glycosyltransferase, CAZy family GT29 n=1 Tax=Selaginella moellendorffii TaxID=88036 RepID=D8SX52_SELML|nr:glycosyltransferase, CAZy family GT29 [Selaginella moellendorffii]